MPDQDFDPPEISDEQLRAALKGVGIEAKRVAFSAGLPIFFVKNDAIVALYEDGREIIVETIDQND